MKTESTPSRALNAARSALRVLGEHRLLLLLVLLLGAKQIAGAWILSGKNFVTPNMALALLGEGLLLVVPAFAFRGRARLAWLGAADLLVTAAVVADLVYNRQFADLPSVASLKHAWLATRAEGIFAALVRWSDLLFVLAGPAALALVRPRRLLSAPTLPWRRAAAVAFTGLALAVTVAATSTTVRNPVGMRIRIAHRLGPFGYHAYDAATYFGRAFRQRRLDKGAIVADALALTEERAAAPRPPPARGLNVVVVQMEGLQAFAAGLHVGGQPVTPTLDRLAKESLRFPRFFSQIAQGNTADAEFLAGCSLQPSRIGAAFYEYAGNRFRCLPELFRNAGWSTVVMHANDPEFWGRATTYPAMGYERFLDTSAFSQGDVIGMGPSDATFFEEAVGKLRAVREPYYAVLISLTAHGPFVKRDRIPQVLRHDRAPGTTVAHYLDAIRYADEALGRFVEALRRDGSLDRTVLVVYGDHWGISRANSNLGDYLGLRPGAAAPAFVAERRVPLLIRIPGRAGADVDRTAGQIDLPPTIAALVGLPAAGAVFLGRDLLDGKPGRIAFPSGSGADDEHLFLSADAGGGSEGCVRISTLEPVRTGECRGLKVEAERELRVGWGLLDANLIVAAGDERARRAAGETATGPSAVPVPR